MDAYTGGAWRSIGSAEVRVDGAWRRIVRAEVYTGGAWKSAGTFVVPLTGATATPTAVSGAGYAYVTTDSVAVSPTGGLAPYTYSWARVSGSYGSANSPTSATTSFSGSIPTGTEQFSTFRCTVTDSLGTSVTVDVVAQFIEYGGFA